VSVVQNLQASFNNKGVDNDGVTPGGGAADTFDEGGQSYSAQALASPSNRTQPLTPGARFAYNGVSFQWPSPGPGSANNVKATGQTINLTQISGTKIAFLGAACDNGSIPITGTMTVNYTNMSAQTVALAFDDWSHDPSTGPYKIARNSVVTDMPYRDNGSGAQMLTTHVYYTELPLDPTRTVKSITLPPIPRRTAAPATSTSSRRRSYSELSSCGAGGEGAARHIAPLGALSALSALEA